MAQSNVPASVLPSCPQAAVTQHLKSRDCTRLSICEPEHTSEYIQSRYIFVIPGQLSYKNAARERSLNRMQQLRDKTATTSNLNFHLSFTDNGVQNYLGSSLGT